jgi:hypothetical protein
VSSAMVEKLLSRDEMRVKAWLSERSNGAVTGGDDPIGFILAHYGMRNREISNVRLEHKKLMAALGKIESSCLNNLSALKAKAPDEAAPELLTILEAIQLLVRMTFAARGESGPSTHVPMAIARLSVGASGAPSASTILGPEPFSILPAVAAAVGDAPSATLYQLAP